MEVPKDLGHRIAEATRLAVLLHLEREVRGRQSRSIDVTGGTGRRIGRAGSSIDGVDYVGGAATDGGELPLPANFCGAGTLAAGGAPAAKDEALV